MVPRPPESQAQADHLAEQEPDARSPESAQGYARRDEDGDRPASGQFARSPPRGSIETQEEAEQPLPDRARQNREGHRAERHPVQLAEPEHGQHEIRQRHRQPADQAQRHRGAEQPAQSLRIGIGVELRPVSSDGLGESKRAGGREQHREGGEERVAPVEGRAQEARHDRGEAQARDEQASTLEQQQTGIPERHLTGALHHGPAGRWRPPASLSLR